MTDTSPLHQLVMALSAIIFLMVLWALIRVINSATNDLEWADLISVTSREGRQRADWNQIGKGLGVVLCVWLPGIYAYSPKMDSGGLALLMGVALSYLGGVSAYAATLRAKQGTVETSRTVEPVPDPSVTKTTETVTETPPVSPKTKR